MRLISCYIAGFGKIEKESISFDSNLTAITKNNGYGKTTLANFLVAMFYGMETSKASDKALSIRQHYRPFSGARYGGNLVFMLGKDKYKIEREFDAKSATKDTLTVYKNDLKYEGLGTNIGESIFNIDFDSFKRTIFIDADDIEIKTNDDINAKLSNFVEGTRDDANVGEAIKRLLDKGKDYKKSNRTGLINETETKISEINARLANLYSIKQSLSDKYLNLKEVTNNLDEKEAKLKEEENKSRDFETYQELLRNALEDWTKLNLIKEKYHNNVIDLKDVDFVKEAIRKKNEINQINFDFARFSALEKKYQDIPNINTIRNDIKEYNTKSLDKDKIMLELKFKDVTDKDLNYISQAANDNKYNDTKKKQWCLGLVMVALLVVGILCISLVQNVVGIALLVICLVVDVILDTCLYIMMKKQRDKLKVLAKYRINNKDDLKAYKEDYLRYQKIKNENNMVVLENKIKEFFLKYGFSNDDFNNMLINLQQEYQEYNELKKTKASIDNNKQELAKQEKIINDFADKYNISYVDVIGKISEIESDAGTYRTLLSNYNNSLEKANDFKVRKNLGDSDGNPDIETLNHDISLLKEDKMKLEKEIDEDERDTEQISYYEGELEGFKEKLTKYKNEYNLINKTIELLNEADLSLKNKYVAPIKDKFSYYANMIEEALGKKVTINPNLEIVFEENGNTRKDSYLSLGERSICAFCFRMALIENMYKEERPFLILDDPFVSLDSVHFSKVKDILKTLSANRQIIYLTCHESRSL